MRCPDCGETMVMVNGLLVCPECEDVEMNKTMSDDDRWIQGENDA